MKRVLMISYFFPPLSGIGVHRSLRFVRRLPDFGWRPVVLTVGRSSYWARDPALLNSIPSGTVVTRVDDDDVWSPYRWLDRMSALHPVARLVRERVCFPDGQRGWLSNAVEAGFRLIREENVRILFSTSAPYTSHLVARELKRRTGLPWIADFRDEWSENPWMRCSASLRRRHRVCEAEVLRDADMLTTVGESISDRFRELSGRTRNSIGTITNGFDEEDFAGWATEPPADGRFKIAYAGQISRPEVVVPLAHALTRVAAEDSEFRAAVCLRVAGPSAQAEWFTRELLFPEIVEHLGYLPHRDALGLLAASDRLLLVLPWDRGEGCLSGKIFEYLAARREILALVPPAGAAAQLVAQAGAGVVVAPDDTEAIARALKDGFFRWKRGERLAAGASSFVEAFSASALTRDLATRLDALTGSATTAPSGAAASFSREP